MCAARGPKAEPIVGGSSGPKSLPAETVGAGTGLINTMPANPAAGGVIADALKSAAPSPPPSIDELRRVLDGLHRLT